jgi:hypothetical protein
LRAFPWFYGVPCSGDCAPRNPGHAAAPSLRAKRSNPAPGLRLDCFVASLLAMTVADDSRVSLPLNPGYNCTMANFMSHFAVPVAIGAVAVVLLLGLANMMRGGSANTSQRLMRLRVLLQFIAIIVIMTTLWFMSK